MKSFNRCYMKTVSKQTFKKIHKEWSNLIEPVFANGNEAEKERYKELEKKLSDYGFARMTELVYDNEASLKLFEQYVVNYYRNYLNPWEDKGTCAYMVYKLICRHHPSRSCMIWNRRALRWLSSHRWMDYCPMAPRSFKAHKASSKKERMMLEKIAVLYQKKIDRFIEKHDQDKKRE